jgi:hypothetical protein
MNHGTNAEHDDPNAKWALTSDPIPSNENDEPHVEAASPPDARGQCLLFCLRCGLPSDGRCEFCRRCGAKRCVSCGE